MTDLTDASKETPLWPIWLGRVLVVVFSFWCALVVLVAQAASWLMSGLGMMDNSWIWLGATAVQTIFIALPAALLSWRWPHLRYRAIFQTWFLACAYPLIMAPTRLLLPSQSQLLLLAQLLVTAVFLQYLWRQNPIFVRPTLASLWLAIGAALLISLPWLVTGALGSPLDTLLALLLGVLFGAVVGLISGRYWLHTLAEHRQGSGWDITLGGFGLGTAVLILASALSFNGIQLLLIITLPALAWAMMVVALVENSQSSNQNELTVGLLVGLVAAAILAFTDSDGMNLVAFDGILFNGLQAMLDTAAFALLMGLLLFWLRKRLELVAENGRFLPAFALLIFALSLALYLHNGQSGFHGDRLFVILHEQADVSQASSMADYDQRRQYVYHTLTTHARQNQAKLRQQLDRWRIDYTPYYLVNGLEIEGGLLTRLWLATRPEVAQVMPSPVLRPAPQNVQLPSESVPAPNEPQWNLTNIGADRVWQEFGVRGAGIIIGQSDSGVQWDHPELQDGYLGGVGNHDGFWLDPWDGTTAPNDFAGHGTHTLGSVLGNTTGVAPEAQWFACANLVRNLGNPALYLDCLQFMLAPYPQGGDPFVNGRPTQSAHILNNSWGCPQSYEGCDPLSLLTAVQALRAAGIFVVVSAGNSGPDCNSLEDVPAIYAEVFAVGAVDQHNYIANFSSTGPVVADGSGRIKPDIAAPGVDVLSAMPGNSYGINSGTSMAGPHVAGVVALIWSANPALIGDIEGTEAILQASTSPLQIPASTNQADSAGGDNFLANLEILASQTADPTGDSCLAQTDVAVIPNSIAGYGIVNAYEAVRLALAQGQ